MATADPDRFSLLVVEDNPGDELLLRELLEESELKVTLTSVRTLAAARDALQADDSLNVALLDLGLPDSDGLDSLHALLDLNPVLSIVVLTGRDDQTLAQAAIRAGAQDYLVKGQYTPDTLARVIPYARERLVQRRKLEHLRLALHAIHQVNQLLSTAPDPDTLLTDAVHILTETRGYRRTWLLLTDDISGVERLYFAGMPEADVLRAVVQSQGMPECAQRALQDKRLITVKQPTHECPSCPLRENYDGLTTFVAPLAYRDRVFGVINVSVPVKDVSDTMEHDLVAEIAGELAFGLSSFEREEHRKRTEKRYARLLDSISEAIVAADMDGTITVFNPGAEKLYNCPADEAIGTSIARFCPEEYLEEQDRMLQIVCERGSLHNVETVRMNTSGDRFHVSITLDLQYDDQGTPVALNAIIRDISERKKTQQMLQEREHMLANAERLTSTGAWEWNLESDVWTLSENWRRIHGVDASNMTSDDLIQLCHPGDLDRVKAAFNSVRERGADYSVEHRIVRRDNGEVRLVHAAGELVRDEHGNPIKLVGAAQDITDWFQVEEELRLQAEMLDSIGQAVITTDRDGVIRYINRAAEKLYGWSRDEVVGHPVTDITPTRLTRAEATELMHRLKSGESWEGEFLVQNKAGEEFLAFVTNTPLVDSRGDVIGVIGVSHDITDRKEAERALSESERQLRTLMDNLPGIAYRCLNTSEWPMLMMSQGCQALLGYSYDVFLRGDVKFRDMIHPDDRAEVWEQVQASVREKRAFAIEYRVNTRDGSIKWVSERGVMVDHHDDGTPILEGLIIDISDRVQMEEAMRESERRFRSVIEQSNDAIYIIHNHRFDLVNDVLKDMTGLTEEELCRPDFDFMATIAPEDHELIRDRMRRRERGESLPPVYEFTILHREGKRFRVQASVTEINYRNSRAVLGMLRDVTERQALEEQVRQSQKMESVGRLAGGVAHDFNNMLQTILANAEIAQMPGRDPADLDDLLKEIQSAASRSAALTRQLLAFARQQPVEPRVVDLNDAISGMLKMLQRLIGEDIQLAWLPHSNLRTVLIDPTQIDQILANLAVNARDAISGGGKITVGTQNVHLDECDTAGQFETLPGDYVLLTVSDDGSGMDEETQARIFEPFFTTKPRGEGTGLGLATIYGIVKQNNGQIHVYSEPGVGTTFKIYLPAHGEALSEEDIASKAARIKGGTESILIVEDEAAILRIGRRILAKRGYQVLTADTPEKALAIAREHGDALDLVITDVVMPDMNGRDLVAAVSEICPGIRTLFMSGYTADVIANRGVLEEGVNFIQKPFTSNDFAAKVRQVLDDED